jgi:hypothetical protein
MLQDAMVEFEASLADLVLFNLDVYGRQVAAEDQGADPICHLLELFYSLAADVHGFPQLDPMAPPPAVRLDGLRHLGEAPPPLATTVGENAAPERPTR